MKKQIFYLSVFVLASCGSVTRTMFGTTEKNLIKTVSIEQGCDVEKIQIVDKIKGLHGAIYALDVCDKRIVYKQVGSVFMESSEADKMIENLNEK